MVEDALITRIGLCLEGFNKGSDKGYSMLRVSQYLES